MRRAAGLLDGWGDSPGGFGYAVKRRLLGPPLVNEELSQERLSKPIALGVLSPDGISSSAYGTEEILIELMVGGLGMTAFTVLLPITGVILLILLLVVLSYREVVTVYTRTGGSYVVAREAFGPRVAQIAAVALLIDYTVTVAVQTAGGAAAVVSAVPALATAPVIGTHILTIISVLAILIMCYGNLRGIREAGRSFALPTYLFTSAVTLMIVVGVIRKLLGTLPVRNPATLHGSYFHVSHSSSLLISFALVLTLLRAFANGGSSLTGIEAVSNAVSAFRPPEGVNARRVLVTQGCILGFLICGVCWLAYATHATPFTSGTPTVISQEASLVFGGGLGHVLFYIVQAATALILFTGGNTSFNGFPFLASFVAEDAFLPRWLTKRGHRLVFSNGIIVLTIVALVLIIAVGSTVNALVPLYAIGVFTGFSMAGFGMARYHTRRKEHGWRRRRVINFSAGAMSALVVVIMAVVKFTQGAWIVVIAGPILVFLLMRLNREYRMESKVLATLGGIQPPPPPHYPRRTVLVFVDGFDLATLAALRYARSLRPTTLRAVHFVIDNVQATRLREDWTRADRGVILDFVDCPDRRLTRAAAELVEQEVEDPGTHVTVILPRRIYSPLLGRLLHDRTADKIARVVSRIPRSAATIVPYDVQDRVERLIEREAAVRRGGAAAPSALQQVPAAPSVGPEEPALARHDRPPVAPGADPIGSLRPPGGRSAAGRVRRVEGRVRTVEIRPVGDNYVLACTVVDDTGELTALFYGRQHIPGVEPGAKIRLCGSVGVRDGTATMTNPTYELVPQMS